MVPLTRHGWREMLIGSFVLVLVATASGLFTVWQIKIVLIPLAVLVLIWLFAFFRDPERKVPAEQHLMVSPADGKVSDIGEVHSDLLGGPAIRVGIFLSVFNVHINRSPCDGKVRQTIYKTGKFVNAMRHDEASNDNESNTIVLEDPQTGRPVAVVKQIVGLIARRIICTAREGETVARGQRIGLIKFGSRTELYIPTWLEPKIKVQIGQNVRGASDIIAELTGAIHTQAKAPAGEEFEPLIGRETPA